jgi:hypothetical protein
MDTNVQALKKTTSWFSGKEALDFICVWDHGRWLHGRWVRE